MSRQRSRNANPSLTTEAPQRFTPAGAVHTAELTPEPLFINEPVRLVGKKGEGVRYERKAQSYLEQVYGESYVASPWLRFRSNTDSDWRYCQPDGLHFDFRSGLIVIVEIKLKHTAQAWWQVRELYQPVLECLFGNLWQFAACEVVKWYDPHTYFPEAITPTPDLAALHPGSFGLHIWTGRRRRLPAPGPSLPRGRA